MYCHYNGDGEQQAVTRQHCLLRALLLRVTRRYAREAGEDATQAKSANRHAPRYASASAVAVNASASLLAMKMMLMAS